MCIYYPGRPSLTYQSGEHIIQATIGGIQKLPKGYVSDQFNQALSKLELDVFREGLPGFARVLDGPGKRGKLAPRQTGYFMDIQDLPIVEAWVQTSVSRQGQVAIELLHGEFTIEVGYRPLENADEICLQGAGMLNCGCK